jgi:osmoprotectant transport system permease protein
MNYDSLYTQLEFLPDYLGGHLLLTIIALLAGIVICVPLGLLVTRVKWLQWPTLTVVGVLQTIPGLALLALMVPLLGKIGFLPAILALTIYSFLPILQNTITGILEVDSSVTEAARGIGMTDAQMMYRVEIPIALPVIIAGIRTAAVWIVGTATLATPVGAISLGNYVFSGLQTQNVTAILIGCTAAALLAITLDRLIRLVEIATVQRSRGLAVIAGLALVLLVGGGLSPMVLSKGGTVEKGKPVVIGSKPFTEQYILAGLISNRLVNAGYETDLRSGMGSMVLFEALSNGAIDCYVDYTGTIWTNVMKRNNIPPREEILNEMNLWLKQNHNIVCLGNLGFENTYALAVRCSDSTLNDVRSIADLAEESLNLTMGSDYEFYSRPEWEALKTTYGLDFNRLVTMDPTLMYDAIVQGEVDVISAYSTDGRIAANDLCVLRDPRQALPPYDAVILLSAQLAKRSEVVGILQALVGKIDNEAMRDANKMVDLDGLSLDSAVYFLREHMENYKVSREVN